MKAIMAAIGVAAFGLTACASRSFVEPPRESVGPVFASHGVRWSPRLEVEPQQFAWLEGCWASADGDQFEGWSAADATGARSGVAVISTGGVEAFREAMELEVVGGEGRFTARLPGGAATAYNVVGAGDGWVRFENPRHDDPKVIVYDRDSDRLRAWIGDGPSATRLVLDARAIDCPRAG
jgi:hypothetical protein